MVNLLPTIRLAQLILKHKFPSVDKPLRIYSPPKIIPSKTGFEKYNPQGLFSEFYSILAYSVGLKKLNIFKLHPRLKYEMK